jgi:hypothetical protein
VWNDGCPVLEDIDGCPELRFLEDIDGCPELRF